MSPRLSVKPKPRHDAPRSPRPSLKSTFVALRSISFRTYAIGQLASYTGSWAYRIAQDWLVLSLTGSATAVGLTVALQFIPPIVLGPFAGSLADRRSKRLILLITQTIIASCALVLALITLNGHVQAWHVWVAAGVVGIATGVDGPCRQAFVNELVGPRYLRNAISLNSALYQVGALAGPALAGILIGTVGTGWTFALTVSTYGFAIITLTAIRADSLFISRQLDPVDTHQSPRTKQLLADPGIRFPMLLQGIFAIFTLSFPVILVVYSRTVFNSGASTLALLTGSLAIGSLIGALIAARVTHIRLRGLIGLAAFLASAEVAAAMAPSLVTFACALALVGVSAAFFGIAASCSVQVTADNRHRGRILGCYLTVVYSAGCIGGPLVGAICDHLGARYSLLIGGIASGLITVILGLKIARKAGIPVVSTLRRRCSDSLARARSQALQAVSR